MFQTIVCTKNFTEQQKSENHLTPRSLTSVWSESLMVPTEMFIHGLTPLFIWVRRIKYNRFKNKQHKRIT